MGNTTFINISQGQTHTGQPTFLQPIITEGTLDWQAPANESLNVRLGDSSGSTNFNLEDSGGNVVYVINSDGIPSVGKASTVGIKVDTAIPTFGYRDILGYVLVLSPGPSDPTLTTFRDNIKAFSFSNNVMNEAFMYFHIPHDYVLSSDIFIHAHWSQNVVDSGGPAGVPGNVKWQFDISYSKGHNQAAFPASFTTSLTVTASGTQYQHMLSELQLSAASPSATQINSNLLEPDGIILCRVFRDPTDAADTLNQVPFLHYVDIHYQSTNLATKAKAPNFYV